MNEVVVNHGAEGTGLYPNRAPTVLNEKQG